MAKDGHNYFGNFSYDFPMIFNGFSKLVVGRGYRDRVSDMFGRFSTTCLDNMVAGTGCRTTCLSGKRLSEHVVGKRMSRKFNNY